VANRFWVGGTGAWNASATSHWSATSGGASGASVPTANDDVFIDANSGGGNINVTTGVCHSLDCTGAVAGTSLTLTPATTLQIFAMLKLVVNVTLSFGTATVNFTPTTNNGGAGWPITTAGNALPQVTLNGTPGVGKVVLQDTLTCAALLVNAGTFDTGSSQTINALSFSTSSGSTRTLTLNASAINLTGPTGLACSSTSNLTVTANTAVMTINVPSAGTVVQSAGIFNWNGLSIVINLTGFAATFTGGTPTFANVTINGNASLVNQVSYNANGLTVTGTLTIAGAASHQRILIGGNVAGLARNFTAANTVLSNVDFMDIAAAGAAAWTGTMIGDCLGNTGITFTASATQTWVSTSGGNWSDATKWSGRVPLPQDDVSFAVTFVSAQTITTDEPRLGRNIDWSVCSWTGAAVTMSGASNTQSMWYGNLTMKTGMFTASVLGNSWQSRGRGTQFFNPNGVSFGPGVTIVAPGGVHYLMSSYVQSNNSGVNTGTYHLNGFNITWNSQWTVAAGAVCDFGTGTHTLTSVGSVNIMNVQAGGKAIADKATFNIIGATGALTKTWLGGGGVFGTVNYTVNSAGTAPLVIGDTGNTFLNFNMQSLSAARALKFLSGSITEIGSFNIDGTPSFPMGLSSVTPGAPAVIITTSPWYAGAHSSDLGGNKGIVFAAGGIMDYLNIQDIIGLAPQADMLAFMSA
jgi:hypothetical protein